MKAETLLYVVITFGLLTISYADVGYKVVTPTGYTLLGTSNQSKLYSVDLPAGHYNDPILIIDLHGSRYQMGFDYGVLLGKRMVENYNTFLASLFGDNILSDALVDLIMAAMDWQWHDYLEAQLPAEYMEEIRGTADGARSVGVKEDMKALITRMITVANLPGDPQDLIYILIREFLNHFPNEAARVQEAMKLLDRTSTVEPVTGLQCSMFAVWGSRTVDGSLLSARNLDWAKDTGIQKNKLIAIYHPDGAIAHATLGYVGLDGALTGMSSAGITVHEANLEENEITFNGFPWLLRLRYIMENAHNLAEGQALWKETNNTVGFNHMMASASDRSAMVEETMFNYTAYFKDDDEREENAYYVDAQGNKQKIGFPLKEALWRTNHGYDPTIRAHFEWSQSPSTWSMQRYIFIHDGFVYYENAGIKMSELEAINITAIAGDKGHHAYQCEDNTDGTNVLSATYHPSQNKMYAAWENGHGSTWRPACCNSYVAFDMTKWW